MKVIITKGCWVAGKRMRPDEKKKPVELDDADARRLLSLGAAKKPGDGNSATGGMNSESGLVGKNS